MSEQRQNEYPPEARWGWEHVTLTDAEMDEVVSLADNGKFNEADALVDKYAWKDIA